MARCLLFERGLLKEIWVEVVNTVIYLQNRPLTKSIKGKTPFEMSTRVKPSIAHLKVFGSICYSFIPEVKRDELDQRAQVSARVSYSSNSRGYKILDDNT